MNHLYKAMQWSKINMIRDGALEINERIRPLTWSGLLIDWDQNNFVTCSSADYDRNNVIWWDHQKIFILGYKILLGYFIWYLKP
jgi:hypothetical protein